MFFHLQSLVIDSKALYPPLEDEIKDGQWMGVTVKSQKPGGKVLVCAHRYIRKGIDFQWGHGLCYTLSQYLDYEETWEPCKGRPVDRAHEDYGYCQAGTSGLLLDDDTALIGTPGVYTWRGTVFLMSFSENYLHRDKTHYYGPHQKNTSPVDKYSYLGMSVVGAEFLDNEMAYAAGAPRSNGTGQVIIFSKTKKNPKDAIMKTRLIISGEQFASSFGYEISTADVNGDRLPDLIVGAPFFFEKDSGGAVYIYYNNPERCLTCSKPQRLTGKLESRFGFAITSLGDLNKDGIDDIAIGAPYEDLGVVYIYLGSPNGLIKEPSQIIKAQQIAGIPKTFGYSLSGKVDMDLNGYPDLLVGAYEADSVVLLRARPIINITTEVTPAENLKNIDPTKKGCPKDRHSEFTCFYFETCCNVLNAAANSLTVTHRIEAETFLANRKFSRVWFGPDAESRPSFSMGTIILRKKSPSGPLIHCQEHVVYVKENTRDIQSPIKMKLSYTLVQDDPEIPSPGKPLTSVDNHPILNQQEAAKILMATFQKDCGSDDICQSRLNLDIFLDMPKNAIKNLWTFMLGASDDIPVNVTVKNIGESAYETQLFIKHPATVPYNRIETRSKLVSCQSFNKTMVTCNIGNPLKTNSAVTFQIKFDSKQLDDSETELNFSAFVNTTSFQEKPQEPIALRTEVVKKAEVSLKGSARPEQVFYGGVVRGESAMIFKDDIGSKVVHIFQAYNAGPGRLRNLEIHIKWPFQVANNKPQGKWLLYLEDTPIVDAIGGGQCFIRAEDINPLHLEQRPGLFEGSTAENTPSDDFDNSSTVEQLPLRGGRRRRDEEMVVRPEKVVDSEGRKHTVVNMNCVNGTAKCLKFKCIIYNLPKNHEATIRINARLWNSTLVEDYPHLDYVMISSYAEIVLGGNVVHQDRSDDISLATTLAYPESLEGVEPEDIPPWIIIVAACAGILLLLFIVFVLWKIGFFKRRRPDPTLSGNLHKATQE
ncbi:hypothetical protein RUM44_002780 [Polyplax serrata]|uniref:Integrin alpha-2 domain-containing protein n=1 Tax=Polyplax serrata TaxID=468196 RepID=A0ABR1AFV2_POLSC